jgi:hypothetical protein
MEAISQENFEQPEYTGDKPPNNRQTALQKQTWHGTAFIKQEGDKDHRMEAIGQKNFEQPEHTGDKSKNYMQTAMDIVVKVNLNNTIIVKRRTGSTKECNYNTLLVKLYKEAHIIQKKEKACEIRKEDSEIRKPETHKSEIRKYQKRSFGKMEDGGPVTRSRKQEIPSASPLLVEVINYPATQQALTRIIQPTTQQSQLGTPTNSPPRSPTSTGSKKLFTPTNFPSTEPTAKTSSSRTSSVPKQLKRVLHGKTVNSPDSLPKPFIQKGPQKDKISSVS